MDVAGLMLIDGRHFAAAGTDTARREIQRAIQESGYKAFFERLFAQMFTADSDAALRSEIIERARRLPQAVGLELMSQTAAWDTEFTEPALRSVKAPLCVPADH